MGRMTRMTRNGAEFRKSVEGLNEILDKESDDKPPFEDFWLSISPPHQDRIQRLKVDFKALEQDVEHVWKIWQIGG